MRKILAIVGIFMISCVAYAATMTSATKQQIMQMLPDHTLTTVSLITLDNKLVNNNSAMVYFDKQGKVTGQMSMKPDNGPQNDTGTYMVKTNGALCVTWQNWNSHNPICVFIYKTANSLIFINEATNKFETLVLMDNIQSGNQISTTSTTSTPMTTTPATETTEPSPPASETTNDNNNGSMNGMQTNGGSDNY